MFSNTGPKEASEAMALKGKRDYSSTSGFYFRYVIGFVPTLIQNMNDVLLSMVKQLQKINRKFCLAILGQQMILSGQFFWGRNRIQTCGLKRKIIQSINLAI